ncbi:MAG: Uma2 family endonuclease [Gemmataceae bacterium]
MATATKRVTQAPPKPAVMDLPLYQFTVEQYQRAEAEGLFGSARVELIEGYVVRKGPMGPRHAVSVGRTEDQLRPRVPQGWCVRTQMDVALSSSQPLPDVVIAVGSRDDYADHHPGPTDVALVVEVADSSLEEDRTIKLPLYATDRVRVYWIVNIPERRLEVHTRPVAGKNPATATSNPWPKPILSPLPSARPWSGRSSSPTCCRP